MSLRHPVPCSSCPSFPGEITAAKTVKKVVLCILWAPETNDGGKHVISEQQNDFK